MNYNIIGPVTALATFIGIWMGHVLVRKIEYRSASIIPPIVWFALIGIFLQIGSFLSHSMVLSAALGILGMTALFDSFEFFRQQKRVIKGHSPANPANPRHARILEQHTSATTLDLLKRNPIGRKVDHEEAAKLVMAKAKA